MKATWTEVQLRRLKELDADDAALGKAFDDARERDRAFQRLETELVKGLRKRLTAFREGRRRPGLCRLESRLVEALVDKGFVQVTTPIILSRGHLTKMSIDRGHPLAAQVYWIDNNKCLRPMLAPHLYFVLKDLLRLWEKPVRIFEVGPCFRKESQGQLHSSEFTMLNLVEMGLPMEGRRKRLAELAELVVKTAGAGEYRLETETSEVYGSTIDVVSEKDGLELGSGAMGPHPLDRAWKITEPWVGIGFGLERLLMASENSRSLGKMGRSLTYLDGIRLNI